MALGLLIECDPSIKSMILKYDEERHDYIVEDLDDENHLVIKESQLQGLKARLDQVCRGRDLGSLPPESAIERIYLQGNRISTKRSWRLTSRNLSKAMSLKQ